MTDYTPTSDPAPADTAAADAAKAAADAASRDTEASAEAVAASARANANAAVIAAAAGAAGPVPADKAAASVAAAATLEGATTNAAGDVTTVEFESKDLKVTRVTLASGGTRFDFLDKNSGGTSPDHPDALPSGVSAQSKSPDVTLPNPERAVDAPAADAAPAPDAPDSHVGSARQLEP